MGRAAPVGQVLVSNDPATVIVTFNDHPSMVVVFSGATSDALVKNFGNAPLPH